MVRLGQRDIDGLILLAEHYAASYDLLAAALGAQPARLRAITARWRRAGYAATGRLGPGPAWCWLTPARMDTSHLEQVLLNLSVNARDAMPDGGSLLIETSQRQFNDEERHATTPRPGRYVCLSVTDTGTGFTDEARQHVFEPFFTTKPTGRGTGLGLATIYGIIKDAGGDIQLYSEPGIGTTVRVYIPEAGRDTAGAIAASSSRPLKTDGAGRTVLLVEDEPQLRKITARILERHNYRLRVAENPHDALAMIREDARVELLLTDVVMPGMSGLQLAEQAACLRPHLRLLFMSGFPRDLWERGEVDHDLVVLERPFDSGQLLQRVSEALSQHPE